MFSWFKPKPVSNIPNRIYGTVVAASRDPFFYKECGVPDTVMGRFDMLAMHVYLFARRMKAESDPLAVSLSQDVFDLFVSDVERALRELGIGDSTVPKRKKQMIRSFYGQIDDFDAPLNEQDKQVLISRVSSRYLVHNTQEDAQGNTQDNTQDNANTLASYLLDADRRLGESDFKSLVSGNLSWPMNVGG